MMGTVNKVMIAVSLAFASLASVAGVWGGSEFSAMLINLPEEYNTLDQSVTLSGNWTANNTRWQPARVIRYGKNKYNVCSEDVVVVETYTQLLKLGDYDSDASKEAWLYSISEYIYDADGNAIGAMVKNSELDYVYSTMQDENIEIAKQALSALSAKYENYVNRKAQSGATDNGDNEELSETTKNLDDGLDKYSEEVTKAAEDASSKSQDVATELNKAQDDLTAYNEESAIDAGRAIDEASDALTDAQAKLQKAITDEDISALNDAIDEFGKVEEKIQTALDELDKCSGSGVDTVVSTLDGNRSAVLSIINDLNRAKTAAQDGDWDAAKSHMNTAKESAAALHGLSAAQKGSTNLDRKIQATKGNLQRLSARLENLLSLASQLENLAKEINSTRKTIEFIAVNYMTSMNQIGAYLGSTNAMHFFAAERKLQKMSVDDLERWFKFSPPEPLFRDVGDASEYTTIGKVGVDTLTFDNIFRLIGSTYFVTYCDSNWIDRMAQFYDYGEFYKNNIRGFVEEAEANSEGIVTTNWYASRITAPTNWADGASLIVTNGKFSANSIVDSDCADEARPSEKSIGRKIIFKSASDSNVKVNVLTNDTGDIEVTIGVYYL